MCCHLSSRLEIFGRKNYGNFRTFFGFRQKSHSVYKRKWFCHLANGLKNCHNEIITVCKFLFIFFVKITCVEVHWTVYKFILCCHLANGLKYLLWHIKRTRQSVDESKWSTVNGKLNRRSCPRCLRKQYEVVAIWLGPCSEKCGPLLWQSDQFSQRYETNCGKTPSLAMLKNPLKIPASGPGSSLTSKTFSQFFLVPPGRKLIQRSIL